MAHTRKPSHAFEDSALILLGLAQAAVLASWGVSSATNAVNAIGYGPEGKTGEGVKKAARLAGMIGFGVLVAAALVRRNEKRREAKARVAATRYIPNERVLPSTLTADIH